MNKPKLVIISSIPLTIAVIKNRLVPFIKLLINKNINVELVCPKSNSNDVIAVNNFKIIEVDIPQYKPESFFKRALKELSDAHRLLIVAKKRKADGYLVTIPSMFLSFLAPSYLKGSKSKAFLDIRDLQWEYLSSNSPIQKLIKKIFRLAFKRTLNFFEVVSVTNDTELSYVNCFWKGKVSPMLVSNGIMREQFDKLKSISTSEKKRLTVTYIGNIGIAQNLNTLAYAAKKLPETDFVIVGSGIGVPDLEKIILDEKILNIRLVGRVAWNEVQNYYNQSHILYAQLAPEFSGAMPSKLYEYLATGKFIIYGGEGQAVEKLKNFSNNICIPSCNPEALVEAIKSLQTRAYYEELSFENREKIEKNYIREDTASSFITKINELILFN